jgi:tetratricopeptide (TPR) repeat protein
LGKLKQDGKLYGAALEKFVLALKYKEHFGDAHYNMACAHSLLGEPDEALSWLKKAIKYDGKNRGLAKTDDDFDNIRKLPQFQKLLKKPSPKKKSGKKKK